MKHKIQVLVIHGGMTFKNRKDYLSYLKNRKINIHKKTSWTIDYLGKKLGKKFEIIKPIMPLKENAKYLDWKVDFERYFPYLRDDIILIGCSLGGIFLAKYLSENRFPRRIISTYFICTPFDNTLPGEDLVGGFKLKSDLSMIEKNSKILNLLFSKNDNVVPLDHAEKFKKKLKNANLIIYKNKNGHFNISKFPEIVKMILKETNAKELQKMKSYNDP